MTAIKPPKIDCAVGLSFSNFMVNGMTTSGVVATIARTIPDERCSRAICIQLTPSVWQANLFITTQRQTAFYFLAATSETILPLALHCTQSSLLFTITQ